MTHFNRLPEQEQEQRLLELAYQALPQWRLSGELRLIKYRENAVYALRTDSGERYALRVHRDNYHSDASLRSELLWMQALQEAGIGVPATLPTAAGAPFALVATDRVGDARQVDLMPWVEGRQIGSVEEGLGDDPQAIRDIYLTLGRLAARMHNQACDWTLPEGFSRHAWDSDGLVGEQPFWGRFWELEALSPAQRTLVLTAREKVKTGLAAFGQAADDFSMIHADLLPENVMVDGDRVQIIDFDDAGFGWHLFELATALYFIQQDNYFSIAKDALIQGYREFRALPEEKLQQLPLFIAARSFTYLGWVHTRRGTAAATELTPFLVELCCAVLADYLDQ